jgi:Receptor family ligand binding region
MGRPATTTALVITNHTGMLVLVLLLVGVANADKNVRAAGVPTSSNSTLLLSTLTQQAAVHHGQFNQSTAALPNNSTLLLSAWANAEASFEQHSKSAISRVNHVDVLDDGQAYCRMITMNPFSMMAGPTGSTRIAFPGGGTLQHMVAVALALTHLNAGDGTVIPELAGFQCGIKFTADFVDTAYSETQAAASLLSILDREENQPCSFIGAFRSEVTLILATLTKLGAYPQISPLSVAPKLSDKDQFRYLARMSPSREGIGGPDPLLQYLTRESTLPSLSPMG